MDIRITCPDFLFHRGQVLLIPTGGSTSLLERNTMHYPAHVLTNNIIHLPSEELIVGPHKLWFDDVQVSRTIDPSNVLRIPFFTCDLMITKENLVANSAEVSVRPEGLFRLTFRNRKGEPLARHPITFHSRDTDYFNVTVTSDTRGEVFCLGNPFHCYLEIDDFSVTVAPFTSAE